MALFSFNSHTFTNCTAVGREGPTLSNCTTAYSSTSWASNTNYFNVSNGIHHVQNSPRCQRGEPLRCDLHGDADFPIQSCSIWRFEHRGKKCILPDQGLY